METIDLAGGAHGVLLLHGLCANPLELSLLAKRLHRAGLTVRVPFVDGYGMRTQRDRIVSHRDWIDTAMAEFDALQRRCASVTVGGLCIGADLALLLAARRARQVRAVLAISTTLFYDGWNVPWTRRLVGLACLPPWRAWLRHRERAPYGVKNPRLREWIAAQMRSTGVSSAGASALPMRAIAEANRLITDAKRALPQVVAPALILHAREDDVAGPRSPGYIVTHIGAREVAVRWFDDSYHMLTIDNEKDAVADATIDFLMREASAESAAAAA